MSRDRRERVTFWLGMGSGTIVFAVAAFLAGPGTPLSWAVIITSGPVSAAATGAALAIQDRRARLP